MALYGVIRRSDGLVGALWGSGASAGCSFVLGVFLRVLRGCLFVWVVVSFWFRVSGAVMLWKFLKGSVVIVVGIV